MKTLTEQTPQSKSNQYIILNSRGQQYGSTFETYQQAEKWLNKKVSSAAGRLQFVIVKKDENPWVKQ